MKKKKSRAVLSLALSAAMLFNFVACTKVRAANLMNGITARSVEGKATDEKFKTAQMNFALSLFKAVSAQGKENMLISPLSIMLALAMTANGAEGKTLEEMEKVLGGIEIDELNEYLYTYLKKLPSSEKYRLEIANSIWFRDDGSFTVNKSFLQKNADYYSAAAFASAFDSSAVKDVNNWVRENTDGMIEEIIEEIGPETVMYLINAIVFEAQWNEIYEKKDILDGAFTAIDGTVRNVKMMSSTESGYIDDGNATGFVKDYKDGKYSFVALLPDENDVYGYIENLTAEGLVSALASAKGSVSVKMPQFSYEYEIELNDVLSSLGMPTAFSYGADFSGMRDSEYDNLSISKVLHKTYIELDSNGTKAAAVTSVGINRTSATITERFVTLDRPFVYLIVDNETTLPIFMGVVTDIGK